MTAHAGDIGILSGPGLPSIAMSVVESRNRILHLAMATGDEAGRQDRGDDANERA